MPDFPAHMFACDPGLASGVAELAYDAETGLVRKVWSEEADPAETCRLLSHFVEEYRPEEAVVVYERFTITVKTAKNSQAPWSLELIGAAKAITHRAWRTPWDQSVALVAPGDHMGLIPSKLLQANDLWHVGGAGHAKMALSVGVYTYAKLGVRYFWDNLDT